MNNESSIASFGTKINMHVCADILKAKKFWHGSHYHPEQSLGTKIAESNVLNKRHSTDMPPLRNGHELEKKQFSLGLGVILNQMQI